MDVTRGLASPHVGQCSASVKDKGDTNMTDTPKPIRRVVTGNDAQGRSCVSVR